MSAHPLDLERIAARGTPDAVLRVLFRLAIADSLRARLAGGAEVQQASKLALMRRMADIPLATPTDPASHQHYDLPCDFYRIFLGPRMVYSACLFPEGIGEIEAAEEAMLALMCSRAGLEDGQAVLDLGCGWGGLSLHIARSYPRCRVHALTNSSQQVGWVVGRARELGVADRVTVELADVTRWEAPHRFDRVVSVEMFEYIRNHAALLRSISRWLTPAGRLFVQVLAHRSVAYLPEGSADTALFSGGFTPSADWFLYFQDDLRLLDHQIVSGLHYHRTCEAWLSRLDARWDEAEALLTGHFGAEEGRRQLALFKLFFLNSSESCRFEDGDAYLLTHSVFEPRRPPA
ncbi:cyclopropane-fatty-acyl-phospholipid synthase [Nannocystis exedens]|uniref:Cyclopropane-fatty-acyl-phospholipid synthase n=1 Tax=Nannocystis exedens TaxID=54 RepID=A0A1I2I2Y8_9BACT|nr:cyclopropane-fatty-acyl-phospholipid synthase family protein [Nannocystis exedens]PCC68484.1 Cyclopropane-fatty-acyl-phospholipid synthase [Nannocystis exedens]SFF36028.1 cyclopropane-fatty-acyl-phospholipid synthase [Nannocystis exedens]